MSNLPSKFKGQNQLGMMLNTEYKNRIESLLGNEEKASKFLSSIMTSVQKNPELLNCDAKSLINSFMTMAQLELMPSSVSGEAYVVPYKEKAQFQLGYQGLVTLMDRAGVQRIISEVVYENDNFSYKNGEVYHDADPFKERGEAIGAYVIITLPSGKDVAKVMSKEEIEEIGKQFSKTWGTDFSPWKKENDPQRWMWKKTVLKQAAKLVPKNEKLFEAVSADNEAYIVNSKENQKRRLEDAKSESDSLKMGNLLSAENEDKDVDNQKNDSKPEDAPDYEVGVGGKPIKNQDDVLSHGLRPQVDDLAKTFGIDPDKYDQKSELVEAIKAKKADFEGDSEAEDEEESDEIADEDNPFANNE